MKMKWILSMAALLPAGCVRERTEQPDYFQDDENGVVPKHTLLEGTCDETDCRGVARIRADRCGAALSVPQYESGAGDGRKGYVVTDLRVCAL